jgi:hypothetical protein
MYLSLKFAVVLISMNSSGRGHHAHAIHPKEEVLELLDGKAGYKEWPLLCAFPTWIIGVFTVWNGKYTGHVGGESPEDTNMDLVQAPFNLGRFQFF